jgi:pimeloyl-ACP methyl ester carboxylesterase
VSSLIQIVLQRMDLTNEGSKMLIASMLTLAAVALPSNEIRTRGPRGDLHGTFLRADDPAAPVVLIIPGSGPTDRDGNNPMGVKAAPYRLLAEGLAANGISTVRIDKRGMFASAEAVPDANAATIGDYVHDTHRWIGTIIEKTQAKCVWLLGHSEGGLVALAAAQSHEDICGVILVAAPGRPLGDVMKEQLRDNPANAAFLTQAEGAIDTLAAGERVEVGDFPAPLASLFAPAVQGFLISAFSLDPAKLAHSLNKPVLIVQGDRDLQVSMKDAVLLKAAAPEAELTRLANTNHVLKTVHSNDPAENIATYTDPSLPLASGVVAAIVEFLGPQKR